MNFNEISDKFAEILMEKYKSNDLIQKNKWYNSPFIISFS